MSGRQTGETRAPYGPAAPVFRATTGDGRRAYDVVAADEAGPQALRLTVPARYASAGCIVEVIGDGLRIVTTQGEDITGLCEVKLQRPGRSG